MSLDGTPPDSGPTRNDPVPLTARIALALVFSLIVMAGTVGYVKKSVVKDLRDVVTDIKDHRQRNEAENDCAAKDGIQVTLHALLPALLTDQPRRTPDEVAAEVDRITHQALEEFRAAYDPCTFQQSGRKAPLKQTLDTVGGPPSP